MIPLFDSSDPEKPKLESGDVKKRRGRPEDVEKTEQRKKAAVVERTAIDEVYAHWLAVMRPDKKNPPKLDETRIRKIGWAVHDYGVEACRKAIDGCAASDWHMGRNPARKRWDSIELIFRNQQKVDMFMAMAPDNDFGDF